jgi:hypothetical protein
LYIVGYNKDTFIEKYLSSRPLDTKGCVSSLSIKGEAFINKNQFISSTLLFQHDIKMKHLKVMKVISWSNHVDMHFSHLKKIKGSSLILHI